MFRSAEHKTVGGHINDVMATVAYMFLWVLFFSLCLQPLLGAISGTVPNNELVLGAIPNYFLHDWNMNSKEAIASGLGWQLVGACIVAPFLEEILFRGVVCLSSSDENGKLRHWGVMMILAVSFILFGMAHRQGLHSILVQGVIGLLLARLWFRSGPNQYASYFSCVAAHALYNFAVIVGALEL
jgi:membrane protease YdiL (CAAX protease family)